MANFIWSALLGRYLKGGILPKLFNFLFECENDIKVRPFSRDTGTFTSFSERHFVVYIFFLKYLTDPPLHPLPIGKFSNEPCSLGRSRYLNWIHLNDYRLLSLLSNNYTRWDLNLTAISIYLSYSSLTRRL